MPPISTSALRGFFDQMLEIRAFEEVVAEAHRDGLLPGLLHLSIGAEAVTVGVINQLGGSDRLYSSHRPHAHFVAADANSRAVMAELAGRSSGVCRGRGGSMHLMGDRAVMATGIVGGTLPIALGHALALDGDAVVASFFGDGAVQTGAFAETMNLAALWNARVLFVCENNGMAEFTTRAEHTTVAHVSDYGPLFGIEAARVDGTDVEAVAEAAERLLKGVRAGDGPALLECGFSRLRPHYEGDWRETDQSEDDALLKLERRLTEQGDSPASLAEARSAALASAKGLLEEVLSDPAADPSEDAHLLFARPL